MVLINLKYLCFYLGSTSTRLNLAENNESVAKEVSESVENMSKNLKKLGKASSLVSKSSIQSAKNIKKASGMIGQSTSNLLETTERLENVAKDSFKSTIKNSKFQKKQLEKQIEEKAK